jgi:UDP-N-acetyl-2-amino-2-deoxyglucuronate dehydrogenase
MKRFAITGAAGYVAPRHLTAIAATRRRLVAALDPREAARGGEPALRGLHRDGVARFRDERTFAEHLSLLRRRAVGEAVDCLAICSPSDLHAAHARLALENGADAVCEKPVALDLRELAALEELERTTGRRVWPVLQMRLHPGIARLAGALPVGDRAKRSRHEVTLTYVTARGPSYFDSWKGDEGRSGGILVNIGIHFFDLLLWLFGPVEREEVHHRSARRAAGFLELERARASWFLSVDAADLPRHAGRDGAPHTPAVYRSLVVDGDEVDFSVVGGDLHTRLYERVLEGRGFGLGDARPSLELVHRLRGARVERGEAAHPALELRAAMS